MKTLNTYQFLAMHYCTRRFNEVSAMFLDEYQRQASVTAVYPPGSKIIYPAIGLCEEAGEVAGKVKRILRDDGGELTEERREALIKELGDCLWYIAALATDLGVTLEDVAKENLAKLNARKEKGTLKGEGDKR